MGVLKRLLRICFLPFRAIVVIFVAISPFLLAVSESFVAISHTLPIFKSFLIAIEALFYQFSQQSFLVIHQS